MSVLTRAVGAPVTRLEGELKVTGEARYAYEHRVERLVYGWILQSTVARGRIASVDAAEAMAVSGAVAVVTHSEAPELAEAEGELAVLQSDAVSYRGQIVACALAETLEAAREMAGRVEIAYEPDRHDVVLYAEHPRLFEPEKVNPNYPARTDQGDVDAELATAEVTVDSSYSTPAVHNNPMEPHSSLALWEEDGSLLIHDSSQGAPYARDQLAELFGLEPEQEIGRAHV